ncbi:hypothetical protein B0T22DRAFT_66300 [Podospora appendiculata]|uniref:Uncharacterized protein n=1 Tax=Podospora appendiculata TaxID=314037 RepID=A0AAE0XIU1_9PEZI|nr:hypothetical protein B0T22DRAFT_66300 [Podospora appendiculata]
MWNNDGPSISYYGSGSLDAEAEGDVLNWITTPPPPSKEATVRVTSIKLSGRNKSPVASMYSIDTLRPQNLIMFTGSKLDNPRWELILLLHTFLLSQSTGAASSRPLYVTQYPYYFIKEASGATSRYVDFSSSGQISYDSLNKRLAHSDFHSALAQFHERVNKRLRRANQPELINVYDDYCIWDEDNRQTASERDSRDWVT